MVLVPVLKALPSKRGILLLPAVTVVLFPGQVRLAHSIPPVPGRMGIRTIDNPISLGIADTNRGPRKPRRQTGVDLEGHCHAVSGDKARIRPQLAPIQRPSMVGSSDCGLCAAVPKKVGDRAIRLAPGPPAHFLNWSCIQYVLRIITARLFGNRAMEPEVVYLPPKRLSGLARLTPGEVPARLTLHSLGSE